MNAPAQDIRDGGSVWVELSRQRDVLREKIDLSNLAALLVGLNNWGTLERVVIYLVNRIVL